MDRFDYTDGDFCMDMGGGMMMDTQGHMMQDMGSGMAIDMESGEMRSGVLSIILFVIIYIYPSPQL